MNSPDLRIHDVDDGETYLIVASSPDDALRIAKEKYDVPCDPDEGVEVTKTYEPEEMLEIGWGDDGFDPLPEGAVVELRDGRPWKITAKARAWVEISKEGDLLASSVW